MAFGVIIASHKCHCNKVFPVNQTVILDGQAITITDIEVYPSYMRVDIAESGDNTAWLKKLDFYIETDWGTVPYYRDLESVYNEIVNQWHKIAPEDFMEQYEAYLYQRHSESGWENGLLFDCFVGKAFKDEHLLLVDPSPTFMRKCRKINKTITAAFSDFDVAAAYGCDAARKGKVRRIDCLPTNNYQRALCFAGDRTPGEIEWMLGKVRDGLEPKRQSNIFLVLPTKYLEKRQSEPDLWEYINKHFTIFKIILLDKQVLMNNGLKQH